MTFSFGSFFLGWVAGIATASMAERLRPVLVELGAAGYRVGEGLTSRLHIAREDAEDLLAEAKARGRKETRTHRAKVAKSVKANGHGRVAHA